MNSGVAIAFLEACADSAGRALACPYSSSAELDAALIQARRAAGVYGPRLRRWRPGQVAGVAAGLIVLALLLL